MTGTGHHISWPPIGLALLLALLGFWLNHLSDRIEVVDNAGFTHDPDFIVEGFAALAFGENGAPYQRLAATRMMHFMDDDTTVLDHPRMENLDPNAPIRVSAKRALISSDGRQVHFLDEVHMERSAGKDRPAYILESQYLHASSDARVLRSDKPVTLRQGHSRINADAMVVDEKTKLLSLDGNVRGIYETTR